MRSRPILVSAGAVAQHDAHRRWFGRLVLALLVVIGVGMASTLLYRRHMPPMMAQPTATLFVNSEPAGITVLVDGRQRGRTPAQIAVPPGDHQITFQGAHVIAQVAEAHAVVSQVATVQANLWRRTPAVQQLRPPFPGANVTNAGFLAGGRVVLTVALPPGHEDQLWVRNRDGGLQHLGPATARGAVAPSPDGRQVAYLAPPSAVTGASNAADQPLTTVRLWSSDGLSERQVDALAANTKDQLADLSWSPDGHHLLLVVHEQTGDSGTRTQLRLLDVAQGSVRTLVELPSAIVPGSFLWSPHGDTVVFLTRVGPLVSLCLLGISPPSFHYLSDIGQNDGKPLPFPPITWSPDGRDLVYAAPVQVSSNTLSGWLFGTRTAPALFRTTAPWTQSRRLVHLFGNPPTVSSGGACPGRST